MTKDTRSPSGEMALKEMPNVGDRIRYVSDLNDYYMTAGRQYTVTYADNGGFCFMTKDDRGEDAPWFGFEFDKFEKVEEVTAQDNQDLIIELSKSVAELERRVIDQEWEILRISNDIQTFAEDTVQATHKSQEADYKAGQALTTSSQFADRLDRADILRQSILELVWCLDERTRKESLRDDIAEEFIHEINKREGRY